MIACFLALTAFAEPRDDVALVLANMLHQDEQFLSMKQERTLMEPLCLEAEEEMACHIERWIQYGRPDRYHVREVAMPLCLRDDAVACMALGWDFTQMYETGEVSWLAKDPKYGARMMFRACNSLGLPRACAELATLYQTGIGLEETSPEKAQKFARQACDAGDGHGCHLLAQWLNDDELAARSVELGDFALAERVAPSIEDLEERREYRWQACEGGALASCRVLRDDETMSDTLRLVAAEKTCHMAPPTVATGQEGAKAMAAQNQTASPDCGALAKLRAETEQPGDLLRLIDEPPYRWWAEPYGLVMLWADDWADHVVLHPDGIDKYVIRKEGDLAKETTLEFTLVDGNEVELAPKSCAALRGTVRLTKDMENIPWVLSPEGGPTWSDCLEGEHGLVYFSAKVNATAPKVASADPMVERIRDHLREEAASLMECREPLGVIPIEPARFMVKVKADGTLKKAKLLASSGEPELDACMMQYLEGMNADEVFATKLDVTVEMW